jgi:hypothetical protein
MNADAEFRISFSTSFVSDCDGFQRVDLLLFKIFQNIFLKNFAAVYHGIRLCDIFGSSLHFSISGSSQGFGTGS